MKHAGQGVGAAPDPAGARRAHRRPPPLLSRLLSEAGGPHGADRGGVWRMPAAGRLHRLELAAGPRPAPDGCSRGMTPRGSRVRGAGQACRVAPSGRRSGKLNTGEKFRVFDREGVILPTFAQPSTMTDFE